MESSVEDGVRGGGGTLGFGVDDDGSSGSTLELHGGALGCGMQSSAAGFDTEDGGSGGDGIGRQRRCPRLWDLAGVMSSRPTDLAVPSSAGADLPPLAT
uniref:Uncharacterized protein n=1 Tax=Oryza sativa subsp. japonica TaxID=39947 RepID=Q6EQQ4_ORYSJ|nr:hypothetical protein [Oryza sativa Japonica Group]BAD29016.1 hypothetical protein [Oryza sativa Japonica Group]